MRLRTRTIIEGRTKLRVPEASLTSPEPPTTPVFFNPAAKTNRDVSVAITRVVGGRTFCDSLAGLGARGIRIAKEVDRDLLVTFIDFNGAALKLAERNAMVNSVRERCHFVESETNTYLFSRFRRDSKFDFVDLDPFGTPIPFLPGALNATSNGGILSVTATDTAVLCGSYPGVAERRYLATPLRSDFKHENGIRILLNACRRIAAMNDSAIEPIATHNTKHYLRIFFRLRFGASHADRSARFEGYIMFCARCRHVVSSPEATSRCERCGRPITPAGPLWTGPLTDSSLVEEAALASRQKGLVEAQTIFESLRVVDQFPPYSFSVEETCSSLRVPGVSPNAVMQRLLALGFSSTRQPFEKRGVKTEADYENFVEAVRAVAREASVSLSHPRHA